MSPNIIALWTASVLPALVRAFCQLSDCSTSSNVRPNCSLPTFEFSETYQPLNQIAPPLNDPHHLFNLIQDHTANDCIEVLLIPSDRRSNPFTYSLYVACRSEVPINVFLDLHVYVEADSVACLHRTNLFARERIRLNFARAQGLLLLEDVTRQGRTKAWLMLRKRDRFRAGYLRCFNEIITGSYLEKPFGTNQLEFGLKVVIGSALCWLLLVLIAYVGIGSECRVSCFLFTEN